MAAAQPLAAFEERVFQFSAAGARLLQIEGGAQSGNAAADDCNPLHAGTTRILSALDAAAGNRTHGSQASPGQIGNRAYE